MTNNAYQFEALFNHATIGIVVTDKEGKIVNFNRFAETQFNYSKQEVLGKPIDMLVPTKLHKIHQKHRHNFYNNPEPRRMGEGRDLFAQKKDGTEFPVEISLSNYEINGEIFVIAFIIDITVRKNNETIVNDQKNELERISREVKSLNIELEQKVEDRTKMLRETLVELEKSKDELSQSLETEKELGELKSRFVTMASHEFKTPLSTILSSTFLLEKYNNTDEEEKRLKHIHRIKEAVNDMKNILEDFLSLGKLEEGLITSTIVKLNAGECFSLIESTIAEMELNLKNGQQINFHHEGNEDIFLDKNLLKNILINLLSNAIKFSTENAPININCTINKNEFFLQVKDNGIGISDEDKQHLFDRFFRAKNAINIQGTGLGLHIVARYIELMNGTIEFESTLNKGSAFTIRIPQNQNNNQHEKNFSD